MRDWFSIFNRFSIIVGNLDIRAILCLVIFILFSIIMDKVRGFAIVRDKDNQIISTNTAVPASIEFSDGVLKLD